ncbi:hypothetical protein [Chryseobacterium hagamense]|uniref:hypothetical protein n=1 Tax=Chryseobacterium hagamense TaxID=395935 RepID=UPI0014786B9B|nr:hypothetical protein [Chryseobacterium hagamense]
MAKTAAAGLGMTTNLYDASGRTLKTKSTAENTGDTGGSNAFTLSQSNLPNANLTTTVSGTALTSGSHTRNSDTGGAFLYSGTNAGNYGTGHGSSASPGLFGGVGVGNTNAAGNHTHSFTGTLSTTLGSGQSMNNQSAYITVNSFIYLGQ